ncbi:MAG: N-acetyl-anhydromuranmyl-L-alanine amidase [Gammaproteobacteria bacterium RIFCSPHIGHO2_12_FULL_41_20]|nr:MAG: N-acetyl-anhydromuranmyl-L-alanine amidase [Gammaproteobacteria bacterium RIFCSPHIGHO2_12_FULL_41_20]
MKINSQSSLLEAVTYLPSPHCDERPPNHTIDAIIIHGISLPPGQFNTGQIENFFCGHLDSTIHPYFATIIELRVSAHILIKRDGNIVQFVPFSKRAWHAGQSSLQGKTNCNDYSIGIELEGTDNTPYEAIQYKKLAALVLILMQNYPNITRDRIVGHADVAPGRKTDPGTAFDWNYVKKLLA